MTLKKVAFVAMPFRKKDTGLGPKQGPKTVDFDALWERAFFPALERLAYMPIRADNQTGSVIIKDMLDQLVFADLVVVDISMPNGNVYYEAGVRHAAREKGCVLISADWARPLFDLAQITQFRYPLQSETPTQEDYDAIVERLISGIPALADSSGPVYELTRRDGQTNAGSNVLAEVSTVLFDFQTNLRAAKLKAADGDKEALRGFLTDDHLSRLPTYALIELVDAVRDHLNWGEMRALLARLPEKVLEEPFFLEQRALAAGKLGNLHDAIALLEEVVSKYGETPERLGAVGGRYRELARVERQMPRRNQRFAKAVELYRRGMILDLNQYYCAQKLLVTLVERNRPGDSAEAEQCVAHIESACERARELDSCDEWHLPTQLVHAFYTRDAARARKLADSLLVLDWSSWKIEGLVQDIQCLVANTDGDAESFDEIVGELIALLSIRQERLMREILPLIESHGVRYRKSQQVHARPAVEGETIISVTKDGEETSNSASRDDMVVRNLTSARELYLVGVDKFNQRYTEVERVDDEWTLYDPIGEVKALQITPQVMERLNVGSEFYIQAPWGTDQIAREGDYLVSPLGEMNEVYRIARLEFDETYKDVT